MRVGLTYGQPGNPSYTDLTPWLMTSSDPISLNYVDENGSPTIPEVNVALSNLDGDLPSLILDFKLLFIFTLSFDGVPVFTGYGDEETKSYDRDQRILMLTIISVERSILDEMKSWSMATLPIPDNGGFYGTPEHCVWNTLDDLAGPLRFRIFRNVRLLIQGIVQNLQLDWAPNRVTVPSTLYFGGAEALFPYRNWEVKGMTYYDFISLVASVLNAVWFVQVIGQVKIFHLMSLREYLLLVGTEQPFEFPEIRHTTTLGKRIGFDRVELKFSGTLGGFQQTSGSIFPNERLRSVQLSASALAPQLIVNHERGRLPVFQGRPDVRDLFITVSNYDPTTGRTYFDAFDGIPNFLIDLEGRRELTQELSLLDANPAQWATLGMPWRYLSSTPEARYFCRSIEFNPRDNVARVAAWGYQ